MNTERFLKYVWPFFNIINERVRHRDKFGIIKERVKLFFQWFLFWNDLWRCWKTNVPLLYPLKRSEKLRFSVFRGYRSGRLVENGLMNDLTSLRKFTGTSIYRQVYTESHNFSRKYIIEAATRMCSTKTLIIIFQNLL